MDESPLSESELVIADSPTDQGGAALVRRVGGSAVNLVGEFGVLTLIAMMTTVAITRLLHPSGYGVYGSAVATAAVLGAAADFGFSVMLSRDMADHPERHRSLLRAAYQVGLIWSAFLTLVLVGLAFSASITSQRGLALLVLAPSMVFNGLNPARIVFIVRYETRRLVKVDVAMALSLMLVTIAVAVAGWGPVAVAGVVSLWSILGNIVLTLMAERMLPPGGERYSRRDLVKRSAPLGVMSIMTKVYLTFDLVLLGWYVVGVRLGDYAAASKLLTVLAGLAGIVMNGALPALASTAQDRHRLDEVVERVWHWLMICAVPLFVALALFAPIVIEVTTGNRYRGAIVLIRILSVAGVVTVLSNLVGNLMVAMHRIRPLLIQNTAAIVLNVVGNVILIPHYGVYAAAWMTVATEIFVCSCSVYSLRHVLDFRRLFRVSSRPALAIGAASAPAVALLGSQWLAGAVASLVFLVALTALRAWPAELSFAPISRLMARARS